MSNAIFHTLESGSNELQSGFSENQLKLIEKADTQPYLAKRANNINRLPNQKVTKLKSKLSLNLG